MRDLVIAITAVVALGLLGWLLVWATSAYEREMNAYYQELRRGSYPYE